MKIELAERGPARLRLPARLRRPPRDARHEKSSTASSSSCTRRSSRRWPSKSWAAGATSTSRSRRRRRWPRCGRSRPPPRRAGRFCQVGFMKRFSEPFVRAKAIAARPDFGRLERLRVAQGPQRPLLPGAGLPFPQRLRLPPPRPGPLLHGRGRVGLRRDGLAHAGRHGRRQRPHRRAGRSLQQLVRSCATCRTCARPTAT